MKKEKEPKAKKGRETKVTVTPAGSRASRTAKKEVEKEKPVSELKQELLADWSDDDDIDMESEIKAKKSREPKVLTTPVTSRSSRSAKKEEKSKEVEEEKPKPMESELKKELLADWFDEEDVDMESEKKVEGELEVHFLRIFTKQKLFQNFHHRQNPSHLLKNPVNHPE
jgi:hypothetical protein